MREARTVDFLLENAKVTEVSPDEFRAMHGGEPEPEPEAEDAGEQGAGQEAEE
jgi:hypothetical protein